MKKLLLLLLFQPAILSIHGQHPEINFEHLSVQQGLADHQTNCITQDHTGFIWIGGVNGLYKYNGSDFTYFKDPPGCRNCSSFENVIAIHEDDLGLLWIYSPAGIILFDPENEKSMLVYPYLIDTTHGTGNLIWNMLRDSRGNIWASLQTGLLKISYLENIKMPVTKERIFDYGAKSIFKNELILLSSQKYSPDNTVRSIYEDDQGNIWVGCADGLYIQRKGDHTFVRLDKGANKGSQQAIQFVGQVLQIDEDSYWIEAAKGLYLMTNVKIALSGNIPDNSLLIFSLNQRIEGQRSYSLSVDRNKNYLLGTENEIYRIKSDKKTGKVTYEPVSQSLTDPEFMGYGTSVSAIYEDRTGLLWTAQNYYGVSTFNIVQSQFTSYKNIIAKYFSNADINPIYKDSGGNFLIGTYGGGLYKIQQKSNKVTRYDPGPTKNNIVCMQELSPGLFWIGLSSGILEFNSQSGKFRDPLPDTRIGNNLRCIFVWDLLKDKEQLYIATSIGLFVYNNLNNELYHFSFISQLSYDENSVLSLIKMKNGEIWAGTVKHGINKIDFNPQNGSLSLKPIFTYKVLRDNGIYISYRQRLYEDSKGFLWIANYSGIHRINQKTGEVKNYRLFENIDFPEVWSVTEDDHNNLWLGTHAGLCRFNMKTGKVKIFEKNDGVPILIHGLNSVYKDKNGRMYFGGLGGFYSFHPDSLKTNDSIPPIVITDFRLFNKSVKIDTVSGAILTKNISYTRSIDLQHNQNDLSFEFAALDYNQPLKNKYAHKLEGYQDEWIETDAKNRVAIYTNLDPGTYTFRVKGSNNNGVWNEEGTSLTIIIHKPWWGTTLAWCIYVMVFLAVIGGYIRLRLWRLKKEKVELEKMVHVRTHQIEEQKEEILSQRDILEKQNQQITELDQLKNRFFTNVSHEFRTPLSLIQSPVEELLNDNLSKEKQRRKLNMIQRNARRLLNLVNQLLDISKIDGCKMKLELIESDVMKNLKAITGAFASLAETKSIRYNCQFVHEVIISWFDPDKLEKIATNLLSNAFKFTPEGGEIEFRARYIKKENNQMPLLLEFNVKDNGMGIPSNSLDKIFDRFYQVEESLKTEGSGTGIGLSLVHDLVTLLKGEINVDSEQGKGSTFSVQFPLGKKHLKESEFIQLNAMPESVAYVPEFQNNMGKDISDQDGKYKDEHPVILIVEDNVDIRLQLNDNLNREYVIREAIDGIAGLKKATETIPDLIITDLMMPRMDGIELCDRLKNDERTSHIPVILLTAKVTLEDKITGFLTGADDYVPKPFNMAELKARVANLIEQRKKLRDRFSREVTLEPRDISITPLDEKFLKRAIEVVEKHMGDEDFDLAELRNEMNMSRSSLFRKLHALTGQSSTEFIRTIRLKRAASLLVQNFGNVTQVSLEVGFSTLSYFNRTFRKLYGISPVEYTRQHSLKEGAKSII